MAHTKGEWNDFYKKCQEVDPKEILLAFRRAQLILAQDNVKKAEQAIKKATEQ